MKNFCGQALTASDLKKTFKSNPPHEVLRGISLEVKPGETIAIMGKSGEGKSTLLHLLGTLDKPDEGSLNICGIDPFKTSCAKLRNEKIGFIFQFYHLLDDFTVLDNVLIPSRIGRYYNDETKKRALDLLKQVGLEKKISSFAKNLSGGEKQRVAIARALLNHPPLLLADEPTGNLDHHHSKEIQGILLQSAKQHHSALIVVTHDVEFAKQCDRLLFLKDGRLYTEDR